MSGGVNFVKRGAIGRVNSTRLYAFNETLKKEALREKGYWELHKDAHPINRFTHNMWIKRQTQYDPLVQMERAMPVDQKFKLLKSSRWFNLIYCFPLLIVIWFVACYLRYRLFGITTLDEATSTHMAVMSQPKTNAKLL